jgi:DNA-binding NtrC family response regulator
MATAVALVPDLLFGSRVKAALDAAGHEIELASSTERVRERLAQAPPAVLVVDLTDAELDGAALLQSLSAEGSLRGVATLGFYSHVDTAAREGAERAGFDLVVPRSRMAREAGELVTRLAAGAGPA